MLGIVSVNTRCIRSPLLPLLYRVSAGCTAVSTMALVWKSVSALCQVKQICQMALKFAAQLGVSLLLELPELPTAMNFLKTPIVWKTSDFVVLIPTTMNP